MGLGFRGLGFMVRVLGLEFRVGGLSLIGVVGKDVEEGRVNFCKTLLRLNCNPRPKQHQTEDPEPSILNPKP